ncbi:hypothetical protein H2136_12610 [Aeromonas hydrophila]|uniref:Uncharacterized protein n=1 Tax=Aeromonas hydrophila TaxID=644 RepID=A0A926FM14_AERHY|nr:hypothetical protein [Aeromonas hydrophila]
MNNQGDGVELPDGSLSEETSLLAARQVSERLLAQSPDSPSLLLVYFTQAHDAENCAITSNSSSRRLE